MMSAITFQRQDGDDGYIVFWDGDRIGWVRKAGDKWAATDTWMVRAGSAHLTRAKAVKALQRRYAIAMDHG